MDLFFRKGRLIYTLILVSYFSLGNIHLFAQVKRPFRVDDIFQSYNIINAQFSPDNQYAAVVVERPRKDQVIYGTSYNFRYDVWLLDVQQQKFTLLLNGKTDSCSYWNPVWSPDSKKIAVLSTKGQDNVRAYIYDFKRASLTRVHENGINLMNKTFAGANGLNDPYVWVSATQLLFPVLAKGQSYASFAMDYLPYKTIRDKWWEMRYNIRSTQSIIDTDSLHLFPNDASSFLMMFDYNNQTAKIIDTGYFRHVIKSDDGHSLLVVKRTGAIPLGQISVLNSAWNFSHQAGVIDLTAQTTKYTRIDQYEPIVSLGESPYLWSINGRYVLLKDKQGKIGGAFDAKQQTIIRFATTFEKWVKQNNKIYLKNNSGSFLFDEQKGIVDLGQSLTIVEKEATQVPTDYLASTETGLQLVSQTDSLGTHLSLVKNGHKTILHSFNQWVSSIADCKRMLIEFEDGYGKKQKALLLCPAVPKDKNPLVVSCYPGQVVRSMYRSDTRIGSDEFLHLLPLVSKGYYVLIPTIQTAGEEEFFEFGKSVIPAVDALQSIPEIDLNRTSLLGLSYGGYSVYSLVAQSNRFKSAIVLAGFGNLFSSYGNFDVRYRYTENPFENVQRLRNPESGQGALGGPPFKQQEKYLRNSPSFYTDKIQTPLLLIHGDKDFVSIEQAEEMFTNLYRQGKKARFLRFWGEGHNINSTKNISLMWDEIFKWLEQTL